MKYALLALALIISGCCNRPPNAPALAPDLFEQTVALVTHTPDGYRAYCSGVWVGQRYILTAAHCAEDQIVEFLTYDQVAGMPERANTAPRLAFVARVSKADDLALLYTEAGPMHPIAQIASDTPQPGAPVLVVGHPSGYWYTLTQGHLAQVRTMKNPDDITQTVLHISAPVWFGNSGGPAFDEHGELIGISSFLARGPNLAFFVHRDTLDKFLAADASPESEQ